MARFRLPLFGAFLAGSLCLLVFTGLLPSVHFFRSKRWFATRGTVTSQNLRTVCTGNGANHFECHVKYLYIVDGKNFTGHSAKTGSRRLCGRLAKMRPPQKVTVLFNPKDPAESTLGAQFNTLVIMVCVIAAVAISALAGCTVTCYKGSHEFVPGWTMVDGTPSAGCCFVFLVLEVYFCLCGALLIAVSAEAIRRGDKVAPVALVAGLALAIVGTLPLLILSVPFLFSLCKGFADD